VNGAIGTGDWSVISLDGLDWRHRSYFLSGFSLLAGGGADMSVTLEITCRLGSVGHAVVRVILCMSPGHQTVLCD